MLRSLHSSIRRPKKRELSRSFRIPKAVDQALDEEAHKKQWTKSFLIREILINWLNYHRATKIPVQTSTEGDS